MDINNQLDFFLKREVKQREREQAVKQQTTIQKSISRIKTCIRCLPEINHSCSTKECNPMNEDYLINRGHLNSPALCSDVYVCQYGRVHICNDVYRECVMEVNQYGQGTCRISGRYYGHSSLNMVSSKADMDEEGGGGYYSDDGGGGGGGDNDGDYDYDSMGASSYHPFNPPSTLAHTICNPTSRFIEHIAPPEKPRTATILPQFASQDGSLITTTTTTRTTTTTVIAAAAAKSSSNVQSIKTVRKTSAPTITLRPAVIRNAFSSPVGGGPLIPAKLTITSTTLQYIKAEQPNLRAQILNILNTLFYSERRIYIAHRELAKCLENGRKAISNDLRLLSASQQKGERVTVPLFELFVTYLKHVTVHYTLLKVAPKDDIFVERTVAIILHQWQYVAQYLNTHNIPITEREFAHHCLAILYEMRKGGRELMRGQVIPDCEYTRTYVPAIELIDQFGYRKNSITMGFKQLILAYK